MMHALFSKAFLNFLVILSAIFLFGHAQAQAPTQANNFPSKPIRIIVPVSPGSGSDSISRYIAEKMTGMLGQPVIVENKPGGDMLISVQNLMSSPADGYTILMISPSTVIINPVINKSLPYDAKRDIYPLARTYDAPGVLVVEKNSRFKNISDFLLEAKSKKKSISMAHYGHHYRLGALSLEHQVGGDFNHVPYKGGAQAIQDVAGGNVDAMLIDATGARALVQAGKLRVLASTGKSRFMGFPDAPTLAESGLPDYELVAWIGFAVRTGTPESIAKRIESGIVQIMKSSDFKDFINRQTGVAPSSDGDGAEKTVNYIAGEVKRYEQLVRDFDATKGK